MNPLLPHTLFLLVSDLILGVNEYCGVKSHDYHITCQSHVRGTHHVCHYAFPRVTVVHADFLPKQMGFLKILTWRQVLPRQYYVTKLVYRLDIGPASGKYEALWMLWVIGRSQPGREVGICTELPASGHAPIVIPTGKLVKF